jgi:predicted house-cleaning noncanonical NTP pyrophosphatase (MazG superfamily)
MQGTIIEVESPSFCYCKSDPTKVVYQWEDGEFEKGGLRHIILGNFPNTLELKDNQILYKLKGSIDGRGYLLDLNKVEQKPKKLIRSNMVFRLDPSECEIVHDKDELNKLYALKIQEEMNEIQMANHKDIMEFADLVQVAMDFAQVNGFQYKDLWTAIEMKALEKGEFCDIVLNNLNPENPSNKIYF